MATRSAPFQQRGRLRPANVRLLAAVVTAVLFSAESPKTWSAGLPVTSCADDGGAGTLRSAVASAHDGDVVTLSQLPLVCSKVSLTTGAIEIAVPNLTIEGDSRRPITISAENNSRVIRHTGNGTLVLKYLGISDGYYASPVAQGGCIYSAGSVTLFADDDVSHCAAIGGTYGHYSGDGEGGAIFAQGSIAIQDSTVSYGLAAGNSFFASNKAVGGNLYAGGPITITDSEVSYGRAIDAYDNSKGGGIASTSSSGVLITRALIVGNEAYYGAGIFLQSSAAMVQSKISDSTFANNRANRLGGGLYVNAGSITVENTTIGPNFPDGLVAYGGSVTLHSTLAFGSPAYDVKKNSQSSLTLDHNLIGKTNFLIFGSDTLQSDPHLGRLQKNGGRFRSIALLPGSSAIDVGSNPDNLVFDQHGAARVIGIAPDIGSFEFDPDVIFTSGFE